MAKHLPSAARYMRDISDYQLAFEALRVRRAGSLAIMIKRAEGPGIGGATQGRLRAMHSHHVGLRVIHYQLLHADYTGRDQADYLLDILQPAAGGPPDFIRGDRLLADIEDASGFMSAEHAQQTTREWAQRLHARGHTSPLGYTNAAYQFFDAIAHELPHGWIIADYGIWRRPNPFDGRFHVVSVLGRQFTDGQNGAQPHTCPGISGPVDCTWLTNKGIREILQRQP